LAGPHVASQARDVALVAVRWCEPCDGAEVRPKVRGAMVRKLK